jgi:hypothetical protein
MFREGATRFPKGMRRPSQLSFTEDIREPGKGSKIHKKPARVDAEQQSQRGPKRPVAASDIRPSPSARRSGRKGR